MKTLLAILTASTILFSNNVLASTAAAVCTAGDAISNYSATIDKGSPVIDINGKSYRYILGTQAAMSVHLNPSGKINDVKVNGYLMRVGDGETVFVITKLRVTAFQG